MELTLYTSALSSQTWSANLSARQSTSWNRSKRRLGGDWQGQFTFIDPSPNTCRDFFYRALGMDLVETHGGYRTWCGIVAEVDEPHQDGEYWACDVLVLGYANVLAWQKLAGAYVDETTVNASAWIAAMIANQAPYVAGTVIETNTNQVVQTNGFSFSVWDEITRITELGQAGTPWRFEVDQRRLAHYAACDSTPLYYTRGGIIRRRSLLKMYNSVGGSYYDAAGDEQTLTAATNPESIAIYGLRESPPLKRSGFPQAAMESLRDTTLAEYAFPWARPVGAASNIQLFDLGWRPVSQWHVVPAVVRDVSYQIIINTKTGWLTDQRDTYLEEVKASASGLSISTWDFDESNLMSMRLDYAKDIGEADFDITD